MPCQPTFSSILQDWLHSNSQLPYEAVSSSETPQKKKAPTLTLLLWICQRCPTNGGLSSLSRASSLVSPSLWAILACVTPYDLWNYYGSAQQLASVQAYLYRLFSQIQPFCGVNIYWLWNTSKSHILLTAGIWKILLFPLHSEADVMKWISYMYLQKLAGFIFMQHSNFKWKRQLTTNPRKSSCDLTFYTFPTDLQPYCLPGHVTIFSVVWARQDILKKIKCGQKAIRVQRNKIWKQKYFSSVVSISPFW